MGPMLYLSSIVNTKVADDQAMQGPGASATMLLTSLSWDILGSAPEGYE